MLWASRLNCANTVIYAVAGQTEMVDVAKAQHSRTGRAVRNVAYNTALGLHGSMFEHERALFIRVALDASGVDTDCQSGLLQLEPAMWVMAVTATHCPFENLVVERSRELIFDLAMTTKAKLRLADFQ